MTWVKWFAIGRQLLDCAVHLLVGESCTFTFTWKGVPYSVIVKRS